MQRIHRVGLWLAVMGLSLATSDAMAEQLFYARAAAGSTDEHTSTTTPVSATASFQFGAPAIDGQGTMQASAAASPGSLSTTARGTISVNSSSLGGNGATASATARMVLDDLIISPLPDITPSATIPISLNLSLRGNLLTAAAIGSPHIGSSGADARLGIGGSLAGAAFGGTRNKLTQASAADGSVTENFSETGILSGASGSVVTPEATVSVNQPFRLDLTLDSFASASFSFGGTTTAPTTAFGDAFSDFGHTLTFASSGPVFNLPAGYTANSVSGMIVNNHFVPEPSSIVLLGLGSVGLCLMRRWRSRRGACAHRRIR